MSKLITLPVMTLIILLSLTLSCSEDDDTTGPREISDMDEAIAVVINRVLDDEVPEGSEYRCVRMDASIPEGTTIEEYAPQQLPPPGMHW